VTLLARLLFVAVAPSLSLIVTIELPCVVWLMASYLKQYTKRSMILQKTAPELLRLIDD
jgi:hypothetical protein